MLKNRLLQSAFVTLIFLSACALAPRPTKLSSPVPLPSPVGKWALKLTQSGGIAGVMLTVEVSSDGQLKAEDQRSGRSVTQVLPPQTMAELQRLISATAISTPGAPRSGCADCFIYDLEIQSNGNSTRVHADDITINDSGAADLILFLRKLRDSALGVTR